jgi:hypothetical protein
MEYPMEGWIRVKSSRNKMVMAVRRFEEIRENIARRLGAAGNAD